jgi:hypothetical protein
MAMKLNRKAFNHAKELIDDGKFVFDERDAWSEHQPSAQQENDFIERHGFEEYGKCYLGINDERPEDTKGHYEFPYGDFKNSHTVGPVLSHSARFGGSFGGLSEGNKIRRGRRRRIHVRPARSIFSNALNFCRSAIAALVRSP